MSVTTALARRACPRPVAVACSVYVAADRALQPLGVVAVERGDLLVAALPGGGLGLALLGARGDPGLQGAGRAGALPPVEPCVSSRRAPSAGLSCTAATIAPRVASPRSRSGSPSVRNSDDETLAVEAEVARELEDATAPDEVRR